MVSFKLMKISLYSIKITKLGFILSTFILDVDITALGFLDWVTHFAYPLFFMFFALFFLRPGSRLLLGAPGASGAGFFANVHLAMLAVLMERCDLF